MEVPTIADPDDAVSYLDRRYSTLSRFSVDTAASGHSRRPSQARPGSVVPGKPGAPASQFMDIINARINSVPGPPSSLGLLSIPNTPGAGSNQSTRRTSVSLLP